MLVSETLRRLSPQGLYMAHKAKGHVEDVLATIDLERFFNIRKTARQKSRDLNELKYFNIVSYLQEHMKRALQLSLNRHKKVVLDIGTGFGYFPYICEFFGNDAIAIDIPDHCLFDEITQFLGINKISHRIEPFKPLPALDRKFDLVTAFQGSFNRYDRSRAWGEDEWLFFLEDLIGNVLSERGEIAFELNYDPVNRHWLSPGARSALNQYRARIFGSSVRLRRL